MSLSTLGKRLILIQMENKDGIILEIVPPVF